MPSTLHEALVEMFRHRAALAADLLTGVLGIELPAFDQARWENTESVDLTPTQYRADAVISLADTDPDDPTMAVIVEIQLGRDPEKRWTWPVYITTLRARMRCPTLLLVICVDTAVARWAATPIELGNPGARIPPTVLGPDLFPIIGPHDAATPELAVLSAMAHGADPARTDVLDVLVDALATVETEHAVLYAELVLAALPEAARHHLEALMSTHTYEYLSEYAQKFVDQGRILGEARGEARAVLTLLAVRRVEVPGAARARIEGCDNLAQLDEWVRRAATADSVDDLFT